MKRIFYILSPLLLLPKLALANPACIVCTVAIGASLEIARKLGINDNIVGLWVGALLALLGYWTILWFDKKGWNFKARNFVIMLLSFSVIAFIYRDGFVYTPKIIGFLYIDSFLFATLLGAASYIYTQKLYSWLKTHNHGHAHFPFEKVVLPLTVLGIFSTILTYYPL